MEADVFPGAAAELRRRGPIVELTVGDEYLEREPHIIRDFCASAPLDGLRALHIDHPDLGLGSTRTLLDRLPPSIRAVSLLRLNGDDPMATVIALLDSAIPEIAFAGATLGDEGVVELSAQASIGRRGVLDLSGCGYDEIGVLALAGSPHLHALRELTIDIPFTDDALVAIAGAPFASSLERLRILPRDYDDVAWLSKEGLGVIFDGDFPRLRELAIDCQGHAMPPCQILGALERLELIASTLAPDALRALLHAAPRLRHLALPDCLVDTPEHATVLVEAGAALETLDLSGNELPVLSDERRILRRAFGWRVDFEPRWEPWV
jgi:hypothetical protein